MRGHRAGHRDSADVPQQRPQRDHHRASICRWHCCLPSALLYVRGESANLLSIGAVDFGIIVDSTVIMVENIYRVLSSRQIRRTCR